MDILLKYFPGLTKNQTEQFGMLMPLYKEWNEKVNVISRKDVDNLYEKHVLHSLAIARFCSFKADTSILDVGTGGGFPGIPLAVMFPHVHFLLVDSIGKKIAVVSDIAARLGLTNVECRQVRCEELKLSFDFVVSRAVTAMPVFMSWTKTLVDKEQRNSIKNGLICLKGGDVDEEIKDVKNKTKIVALRDYYEEEFFETKKILYVPIN